MDSLARINLWLANRLLPFAAAFADDLRQGIRHWAMMGWTVFATCCALYWLVALPAAEPSLAPLPVPGHSVALKSDASNVKLADFKARSSDLSTALPFLPTAHPRGTQPAEPGMLQALDAPSGSRGTASAYAARVLRWHLLFFSTFVIMLGASAISGEAGIAAEAILCRGISRWQYFAAKCSARTVLVLLVLVALVAPAVAAGVLRLPNDVDLSGLMNAAGALIVVLVALTLTSVAGGAWFRSPLVACAVLWMALFGIGLVAAILEVPGISPVALADQFPAVIAGTAHAFSSQLVSIGAILGGISAVASLGGYCLRDV